MFKKFLIFLFGSKKVPLKKIKDISLDDLYSGKY